MDQQVDLFKLPVTAASDRKLQIGVFVCPGFCVVDIIGLQAIFGLLPNADVHLVWKNKEMIVGLPTFPTHATTTFEECPRDLDVLLIGAVPPDILDDAESLAFLADRGGRARWVAGVCGGTLVLGAAGLLRGYRATSNFHLVDQLVHFGATPAHGGVVEDRNRITAGPAIGSFEIGLRLLGDLVGHEVAREFELQIEYDPHPPYGTGSPERAGPELVTRALRTGQPLLDATSQAVQRAARRLAGSSGPAATATQTR